MGGQKKGPPLPEDARIKVGEDIFIRIAYISKDCALFQQKGTLDFWQDFGQVLEISYKKA